jgi:MFS family permease
MVGVVLSMYGLWQAIIRIPVGVAADIVGRRKPFILGGMFLVGLGAYAVVQANGINGMILGRAIVGLSAGTWVPLIVFFSTLFPPMEAVRASTLLNLVGSASRVLATALNGTLNQIGGFELAYYLAVAAAGVAILLMLPCKEERRPRVPPSFQSVLRLFGRKDVFLPTLLATVCQYAVWATTFGFVPILARQMGATDVTLSLLTSVSLAVLTAGTFFASALVSRIGTKIMLYASFTILCLGVAGAGLAPSLGALFAVQVLLGLGQGIGTPVMMGLSIQNVDNHERNTAMGFHQSVYAIGMFAGPAASGVLADAMGVRAMFGVTAALCLALGLLGTYWLGNVPHRAH